MTWSSFIAEQKSQPYYTALAKFVAEDALTHEIYPKRADLFKAFELCPLPWVKVCLLGQDPYVNEGQAMGLSFSVPNGAIIPPSLRNIYKELQSDLGIEPAGTGNLTAWAARGVLLLNSVLTVRKGESGSHANCGWETFTDRAISLLNEQDRPIVFLLFGGYAKKKSGLIDASKHCVITAAHPSPLSAYNGFFGCKFASRVNDFLVEHDIEPIEWRL